MIAPRFSKRLPGCVGVLFLVVCLVAVAFVSIYYLWLAPYLAGDSFRDAITAETLKGLHLAGGSYAPIQRPRFLTATSAEFQGREGKKAITNVVARNITTRFNPWGIFLRRWQLDGVWIETGEVEIQVYEPKPEPKPPKPWYAIFLPDRLWLKEVLCNYGDVRWKFRDKIAGIFGTTLRITPFGRDFNYQATGGVFRMALLPELKVSNVHLQITRKLATLFDLALVSRKTDAGVLHARARAGLQTDKSIDAEMNFASLPVDEWLPAAWKDKFRGAASGSLHWMGKTPKLETSSGQGTLRIREGHVEDLPFLEKLATLTGKNDLRGFDLEECAVDVKWVYPRIDVRNLAIEARGKFRVEGALSIHEKRLDGSLRLGVTPEYLAWLPKAEEIFNHREGGYEWTTVRLFGTTDKPEQNLSPRIVKMLDQDPGAFLMFFLKQAGESLGNIFGGH